MIHARDAVWQCKGNCGMMEVIQVGKIKVLEGSDEIWIIIMSMINMFLHYMI